jgi:type IV pilus assembly protein PilM
MHLTIQKKRIIGIDIGSSAVKIVRSNGGSRNWKYSYAHLPDGVVTGNILNSSKLLASAVKKAMSMGHIHGGSAALSLSGNEVIIRHAVLPRMNADQLKQNVIDEISGYLSVKPELYNIDYKVTDVLTEGAALQYRVMIVAVPKNIIAAYIQALSTVGIKVTSVDVAANSKEKLINALVGAVKHFAVLDLGMNSTTIDTYQNNRYFINKICQANINSTATDLAAALNTDQLQATEMLFGEGATEASIDAVGTYTDQVVFDAVRVLDYFRSRNNQQPVEHIYLCGGGTGIPGICNILRDKFDMPVTNLADVLSGILTQGRSKISMGLAVFAAAAGAALMEVDG